MDTLENQAQSDPSYCGPRTLTYTEDISGSPLAYVSLSDVSQTYFELITSSVPLSVSFGDQF